MPRRWFSFQKLELCLMNILSERGKTGFGVAVSVFQWLTIVKKYITVFETFTNVSNYALELST